MQQKHFDCFPISDRVMEQMSNPCQELLLWFYWLLGCSTGFLYTLL